MIDMHIHAVHPQLPGVKPLTDLYDGAVEVLVAELREQMRRSGTTDLLGMGHLNGGADDPLGVASTLAIEFTERPDRFLYGTDWPLTPLDVYPDFVRQLFDEADHPAVFEENARGLFKLARTAP